VDLLWGLLWRLLWGCVGVALGMLCLSLGMFWTCFGDVLGMCWVCVGYVLGKHMVTLGKHMVTLGKHMVTLVSTWLSSAFFGFLWVCFAFLWVALGFFGFLCVSCWRLLSRTCATLAVYRVPFVWVCSRASHKRYRRRTSMLQCEQAFLQSNLLRINPS